MLDSLDLISKRRPAVAPERLGVTPTVISDDLLRRDVRMLGDMLGAVITEAAGAPAFDLVERIRLLARERRGGSQTAERELAGQIAGLSAEQARTVARAFSIFFDVANIAEDRQRVRVLRDREAKRDPEPISESLLAGLQELKNQGLSAQVVQEALDALSIELVFTAHPSEAKRRSIRAKLRRMRHALQEFDRSDLVPRERRRLEEKLRSELAVLWQTDFLRPARPSVLEEVERGLSIMPRLWEVVPQVFQTLRRGLAEHYPGFAFRIPVFLRFGSWMGGDRDGNPNVTCEITSQTLCRLRNAAIAQHLICCREMYDYLTISLRADPSLAALETRVDAAIAHWPELATVLASVAPREVYRRWVKVIEWRLKQSRVTDVIAPPLPGDYGDGSEFEADVHAIVDCMQPATGDLPPGGIAGDTEVLRWLDLVRVFGLNLTSLDIRQDARRYQEVLADVFKAIGVSPDFATLSEPAQAKLLADTLGFAGEIPEESLAPLSRDTLALYRMLQRALVRFGPNSLGGTIISLTRSSNDVLSVLWLWRWAQSSAAARGETKAPSDLRVVPLFEKIGDLKRAPDTLTAMLNNPLYAAHLARQGSRQVIMVGYSDSTKDGGYLAASWGLYRAQSDLQRVAGEHGVHVTFFHGRGGSLGRGGGPAARGILSLPSESLDGTLRLTEQGEVLAERYDDVQIAYRHLEQVTWATLVGATVRREIPAPAWLELMDRLSEKSLAAYRELVDQPGFMPFFAATTPIEEIEELPIGSRPARRRGERTLDDLRAIPWVFSWTQNRCLIPAWYGLGAALAELREHDATAWQTVRDMYHRWSFFQATIDNAAVALVKADMYVAGRYAELAETDPLRRNVWRRILAEHQRTRQSLLELMGSEALLAASPWLEHSIEVRNPYIDPLNLIQIELMRRRRATPAADIDPAEGERLRALMRLTVQGIAAGMRTTG
jgi:phosphoenolpyruvate carboxylase